MARRCPMATLQRHHHAWATASWRPGALIRTGSAPPGTVPPGRSRACRSRSGSRTRVVGRLMAGVGPLLARRMIAFTIPHGLLAGSSGRSPEPAPDRGPMPTPATAALPVAPHQPLHLANADPETFCRRCLEQRLLPARAATTGLSRDRTKARNSRCTSQTLPTRGRVTRTPTRARRCEPAATCVRLHR